MPEIDEGSKGSPPLKQRPRTWWQRGYDWHGVGESVTCMLCGATVAATSRDADGKPYFAVHDEWHGAGLK